MENNEISLGQSGKVDFASFSPTKQQKKKHKTKTENAIPAATKKPNFALKLFHEIISFHIS